VNLNHQSITAYLVGTFLSKNGKESIDEHLEELSRLAETLAITTKGTRIIKLESINPSTFIGKGNIDFIRQELSNNNIDYVLFDDDLTPTQGKNLEKIFERRVIDRSEIILEIFREHARSRVAKTQVEIARLEFLLPRLKRLWTHLERQRGGIAALRGGVGEKQIEIDRRIVKDKISLLKKELQSIDAGRQIQRQKRLALHKVAIVGYTNSGKSTLLKALTGADTLIEDKLFATLDSKARVLVYPNKPKIIITDTVGFIRKLPHQLIAAFKSTLDEVVTADVIIEVIDVSNPAYEEHMQVTSEVLKELHAHEKPLIYAFNKIDALDNSLLLHSLNRSYPHSIAIAAAKNIGISELKNLIYETLDRNLIYHEMCIPYNKFNLVSFIKTNAHVLSEKYEERGIEIKLKGTLEIINRLKAQEESR